MTRLVLLVVGAAWAGVLLPPLLRSRMDSRPSSSVTSFRRQLGNLQRSTPGGMAPMRQMARPLAGAPRPGTQQRPGAPRTHTVQYGQQRRMSVAEMQRPELRGAPYSQQRRPAPRAHGNLAPAPMRSDVRMRRQSILIKLLVTTAATGFLATITTVSIIKYAFALSVCLLIGYVYMLTQSRNMATTSNSNRSHRGQWQDAA